MKREIKTFDDYMSDEERVSSSEREHILFAAHHIEELAEEKTNPGKSFRETLHEQLSDPELKTEYDALAAKYQLVNTILDARMTMNITQKQLAEMSGIALRDIRKIENGNANPSLKSLERIASAMGMSVRIEFVPSDQPCALIE